MQLTGCLCLCSIKYTNGDEEELDLNEVIDEGHMSLLT